jgi:hypothetical protein
MNGHRSDTAADKSPAEEFVGEALIPTPGSFDATAMARGEAGCPREFTWRGETHQLAELLSSWKGTGKDRGETYLRRHWFRIRTTGGLTLSIYCERQSRNTRKPNARWWVYTVQK